MVRVCSCKKESEIRGEGVPTFVFVHTQLDENIGACARAMLNYSLTKMVLVAPECNHLSGKARATAAGADYLLEKALLFPTLKDAITDANSVYATTARIRYMAKPILTPEIAASEIFDKVNSGEHVAIVFGCERTGLTNEDIALCDAIISIPANRDFASLNLAQATLIIAYEYFKKKRKTSKKNRYINYKKSRKATVQDIEQLFTHLFKALEVADFFTSPQKRTIMENNLKAIIKRAELSYQEVQTLHGVITQLLSYCPNCRNFYSFRWKD